MENAEDKTVKSWEDVIGKYVLVGCYGMGGPVGIMPNAIGYNVLAVKGDYVLLEQRTGTGANNKIWMHNETIGVVVDIMDKDPYPDPVTLSSREPFYPTLPNTTTYIRMGHGIDPAFYTLTQAGVTGEGETDASR